MERCTTIELREKEVINICSGARLGYTSDFEINPCDGKICALIIPGEGGFFGIGKNDDFLIPWDKVECIGDDTILVRIADVEAVRFCYDQPRRRKRF